MTFRSIDDAFLSRMAELQFPTMPEEETAPDAATPPTARSGDVLVAEVGSRGLPQEAYSGRYPDTITPIDPTVRQKLSEFLQAGFEGMGIDRYKARQHAETIIGGPSSNLPLEMGLADIVPFLGTALQTEEAIRMGEDAARDVQRGNYGAAAAEAVGAGLGLLPGGVATGKAMKAVARTAKKGAK